MRSHSDIVHFIGVADLDLHALAQRWKHLGENDLLVPDGLVAALLHCCFPLQASLEQQISFSAATQQLQTQIIKNINLLPCELHLDIRIN